MFFELSFGKQNLVQHNNDCQNIIRIYHSAIPAVSEYLATLVFPLCKARLMFIHQWLFTCALISNPSGMQPMVVLIELSSVVEYGELTTFSQVLANTTKNRITGEQLLNGKWNNIILLSKILTL